MGIIKQISINIDSDILAKIDAEVMKNGVNKKTGRTFNRSAFIEYAMNEYLKLPFLTKNLISGVHPDFKK
jgi:metal-responsive CopG/Arc/MetJ family transcriptional regulator